MTPFGHFNLRGYGCPRAACQGRCGAVGQDIPAVLDLDLDMSEGIPVLTLPIVSEDWTSTAMIMWINVLAKICILPDDGVTEDEVDGALRLDVVIRESMAILKLLVR